MLSTQEIYDIQKLNPDEQNVIFSLIRCFLSSKKEKNDAQIFLATAREKHLETNPMTMEEIDRIIHESE